MATVAMVYQTHRYHVRRDLLHYGILTKLLLEVFGECNTVVCAHTDRQRHTLHVRSVYQLHTDGGMCKCHRATPPGHLTWGSYARTAVTQHNAALRANAHHVTSATTAEQESSLMTTGGGVVHPRLREPERGQTFVKADNTEVTLRRIDLCLTRRVQFSHTWYGDGQHNYADDRSPQLWYGCRETC